MPNVAVEKPLEGLNKSFFWGHSTYPNVMIVEYNDCLT